MPTSKRRAETAIKTQEVVESVIPYLANVAPDIELRALQLLLARSGKRLGISASQLLRIVNSNLPNLM
jgi:hypothetical protein